MLGLFLVCLVSMYSAYLYFSHKADDDRVVQEPSRPQRQQVVNTLQAAPPEAVVPPPSLPTVASRPSGIAQPATGIYRYRDAQGGLHFADSLDKVPQEYRDQVSFTATISTDSLAVRIVGNHVLVPVLLSNGRHTVRAQLLLDTGCSITAISDAVAARLRIPAQTLQSGTSRVADGRIVPTLLAGIDRLQVGSKTQTPTTISILSGVDRGGQHDGLLGMNFLREHPYQVDYDQGVLRWR